MPTCSTAAGSFASATAARCCMRERQAPARRASRCSSAPRSTATRVWPPIVEILDLMLECLRVAGDRGRRRRSRRCAHRPRRARRRRRSTPIGSTRSTPRLPPRTRSSSRTLSAGFPAPARAGPGSARRSLRRRRDARRSGASPCPDARRSRAALDELRTSGSACAREAHPRARVGFDLADSSGYAYYSGARFAAYARGASDAIARGGRYDEVGAVFGRNRPAVGFGLDVKDLAMLAPTPSAREHDRGAVAATMSLCAMPFAICAGAAKSSSSIPGTSTDRGAERRPGAAAGRVGRPLGRHAALIAIPPS